MCGRFSFVTTKKIIQDQLGITATQELETSYNIAPTQRAYVITNENPNVLQKMAWGLLPSWSRDGIVTGKLINARKEGIQSKPSFRMSVRYKRCLVLADSFYEWRREGTRKIPYRIFLKDQSIIAMAGVWDSWTDGSKVINSFSVITTPPNTEMQSIHSRMPVILNTSDKQKVWLQAKQLDIALTLLHTLEDGTLEMYRISEKLNSPKHDFASLHEAVPEPPTLF